MSPLIGQLVMLAGLMGGLVWYARWERKREMARRRAAEWRAILAAMERITPQMREVGKLSAAMGISAKRAAQAMRTVLLAYSMPSTGFPRFGAPPPRQYRPEDHPGHGIGGNRADHVIIDEAQDWPD